MPNNKSVDNEEIIALCKSYLNNYINATSQEEKKRAYNILYSLIAVRINKSCINDYRDFYKWCMHNEVTSKILDAINTEGLEDSSDKFTIMSALNNLENSVKQLKNILIKECV